MKLPKIIFSLINHNLLIFKHKFEAILFLWKEMEWNKYNPGG